MGKYATTTSLEILMIGLTFDSATTSLATKMITKAENEVDKYLSRRYDLTDWNTSTSIPPLVVSLAETLAEGYLWKRTSRGGKESLERGNDLIKEAMGNLADLRDYKADLVDSSGSVVADMSNTAYRVLSNTTEYSNTFNEDDELNWAVDEDKLDDIDSERG